MTLTQLFGREIIYTDVGAITAENVCAELTQALSYQSKNETEIKYLYNYYRGQQPILQRVKEVRPEINNKVVVNRANEIVAFKVGYLMGEPVQYVCRGNDSGHAEGLITLNGYMADEEKQSKDREIAEWNHICGTAYRMVLPASDRTDDESPFVIYTLDPRYAFVVYSSELGNRPMMGVKYVKLQDGAVVYSIYTDREYFEIRDGHITAQAPHALGMIPIIEYPANTERMGAFEAVMPLLDAINTVESNRLDGIEQFIQALMVFKGVNIESDDYKRLRQQGAICINTDSSIETLVEQLDQMQTQTLVNDMYDTVLTICGMPNRNGGTSTSDTKGAVIFRDGWSSAEGRAKNSEMMFRSSERVFLRLALKLAADVRGLVLMPGHIDIRFTRRNYENVMEKMQVLVGMLSSHMVDPLLAFEHCGMFADPQAAYQRSMAYAESKRAEMEKQLTLQAHAHDSEDDDAVNGNDEPV